MKRVAREAGREEARAYLRNANGNEVHEAPNLEVVLTESVGGFCFLEKTWGEKEQGIVEDASSKSHWWLIK